MKHQRAQCQRNYRPGLSILALVVTLFVLPYITDIPYLEDQAPNHDAEENTKVETKSEADYTKTLLAVADVENDSVTGYGLTPQGTYNRISYPTRGTPASQRLVHALLTSRPPPVA